VGKFVNFLKTITAFLLRHQEEIEKMIMYVVTAVAEDAIDKRTKKSTETA
jgi:hypothetical protein